jgi:hypothetical protein
MNRAQKREDFGFVPNLKFPSALHPTVGAIKVEDSVGRALSAFGVIFCRQRILSLSRVLAATATTRWRFVNTNSDPENGLVTIGRQVFRNRVNQPVS